jgi:hypothetical protein
MNKMRLCTSIGIHLIYGLSTIPVTASHNELGGPWILNDCITIPRRDFVTYQNSIQHIARDLLKERIADGKKGKALDRISAKGYSPASLTQMLLENKCIPELDIALANDCEDKYIFNRVGDQLILTAIGLENIDALEIILKHMPKNTGQEKSLCPTALNQALQKYIFYALDCWALDSWDHHTELKVKMLTIATVLLKHKANPNFTFVKNSILSHKFTQYPITANFSRYRPFLTLLYDAGMNPHIRGFNTKSLPEIAQELLTSSEELQKTTGDKIEQFIQPYLRKNIDPIFNICAQDGTLLFAILPHDVIRLFANFIVGDELYNAQRYAIEVDDPQLGIHPNNKP